MCLPFPLQPLTLVTGHYGVGKTNLSLNLAIDAASTGYEVKLIDLDIVNPYFRTSEYRSLLEHANVQLISPVFAEAGTSLDVPSLTGAIAPAIEHAYESRKNKRELKEAVIIDVGGDDVGAKALGRFSHLISTGGYDFLYVINRYRNLTQEVSQAISILDEVERISQLKANKVIGNSHIKEHTNIDTIRNALAFSHEFAKKTALPLACVTVPKWLVQPDADLYSQLGLNEVLYPVEVYVKTLWE